MSNTKICEKCRYKNSWDCEDLYYRRVDCKDFVLEWAYLTDEEQNAVRNALEHIIEEQGE